MTDLQTPILFLDFDGTISRRDAVDAILETYADPKWLTFESEWDRATVYVHRCHWCARRESRSTHCLMT